MNLINNSKGTGGQDRIDMMKYLVLIAAVCGLAAGCITPHAIPLNDDLVSSKDERELWQYAQKEQATIDNSGFLYRDPELEYYLNRIAKKLQANSIAPDFRIRIKVLKDTNFNAFAYANGVIYVHTGLLAHVNNEAQLAALLSHEMTHCTHRHSLRVIRSIKDRPVYIAAVQQALTKISAVQSVARLIGATGSTAAVNGYTRMLEREADQVGLDLMAKANYDCTEALKLLEHLKQEFEAEEVDEPFIFGTLLNLQQRIANVKVWLAKNKIKNDIVVTNTAEFQAGLQQVVLVNAGLNLRLGRFDAARSNVEKYLGMQPNDAQAYYLLGEILRQRNRQEDAGKAVSYYKKAISLNPSFPEPHRALGLMHYKDGQRQLAKKFFESCLLLSPNASDKAYIQGYLKNCTLSGEES